MAQCLIAPFFESVGPESAVLKATFVTGLGVERVSFGWYVSSCMDDRVPLANVGLRPGQQLVDVTCRVPVTTIAALTEGEPIRFDLTCDDTELWNGWLAAVRVEQDVVLVEWRDDEPERCGVRRSEDRNGSRAAGESSARNSARDPLLLPRLPFGVGGMW